MVVLHKDVEETYVSMRGLLGDCPSRFHSCGFERIDIRQILAHNIPSSVLAKNGFRKSQRATHIKSSVKVCFIWPIRESAHIGFVLK